jgi:hypothetical protein
VLRQETARRTSRPRARSHTRRTAHALPPVPTLLRHIDRLDLRPLLRQNPLPFRHLFPLLGDVTLVQAADALRANAGLDVVVGFAFAAEEGLATIVTGSEGDAVRDLNGVLEVEL